MNSFQRRPAPPRRSHGLRLGWTVLALLCTLLLVRPGLTAAQQGDVDPPGRVARLSEVIGRVWLYHPDNGDWVEATRNAPLTTGDRLATEPGARAELQIGSTTLRLDAAGDLDIAALDDARLSLQLQAGSLALRIRDVGEAGPVEVLTSEGRFLPLRAGGYRIDRGNRSSFVSVDAGQVRYEYASSALTVEGGQRGEFWLDASGAAQYALLAPLADAFTAWNNERDRAVDLAAASRFVSPEMTGAADLVRYGNWEQSAEYGAVWFPAAVAADWAPYSTGRWAWVRPWGWTWVDDAPWGFAPFHYGRWVNLRNRWCWTPGVRAPRPVYAPALVGWVGGGPQAGGSVSIGIGPAVGWFPLAPREVYVPSYRASPRYGRDVNLNITNVTNVTTITRVFNDPRAPREFENRRISRAVTIVPAAVLTDRRPVGPAAAQYRDAPWAREFAQRGGATAALTAPPVAAPPVPLRPPQAGAVRPPFAAFDGRGSARSGVDDRDRGRDADRDRDRGRDADRDRGRDADRDRGRDVDRDRGRDADRDRDAARPGLPARALPAPPLVDPRAAAIDERGRGGVPGRFAAPPAAQSTLPVQPQSPAPMQPPALPQQPGQADPGATRGNPFRPPGEAISRPPAFGNGGADARAPGTAPGVAPRTGAAAVEPQESPRMRPLPIRRGEDRRGDEPGRAESPGLMRPQPGTAPLQTPAQAPATPAPVRPIDAVRGSDRPAPSRSPEALQPPAPAIQSVQPVQPVQSAPPVRPIQPVRSEPAPQRLPDAVAPRRESPREAPGPRPAEAQRPAPAPDGPRIAVPDRRGDSPANR